MLSLSSIDLAVYSGLILVGLSGLWLPYFQGFKLPWPAAKPEAAASDWKTDAVEYLIRLQSTLEANSMAPAAKACRELTWLVLGGDPK